MPNKTFFWFFLPTGLAMILFIGLPIISTGIQSFYAQHDQVVKEVKKCDPFGCTVSIVVDNEETSKIREARPLGKFNGFGTYTCLLYSSPSPRDMRRSRMPSSA